MNAANHAERCALAEGALASLKSNVDDAGYVLDTIVFVIEAADQDCGNLEATARWHVAIKALVNEVANVLHGPEKGGDDAD
jgi:hypothetical protein